MKKTYGSIKLSNDEWILKSIPPHIAIRLKQIFPFVPKSDVYTFKIRNNDEVCCDLKWFMMRYPLVISSSDLDTINKQSSNYNDIQDQNFKIISGEYKSDPDVGFKDGKKLRDYQVPAVDLLWNVKRYLLTDFMGSGKTITALGAMMKSKLLPALVVVQSHLPDQWMEKIKEFTNLKSIALMQGKPFYFSPVDVVVVKYTNIAKWEDYLREYDFNFMVLDEVQEVRRYESNKHKACKRLADNIEYVLGMSGTPIVNYGDETFNVYSVVKPKALPGWGDFSREWLSGKVVNQPEELGSYLKDNFHYLGRSLDEVGIDLDPINKIIHTVGFDQKVMDEVEERSKVLAHTILNSNNYIEKGQAAQELSIQVRKATGISKARYVAEYVKMILQSGEKVVLALWHRECYRIIAKELEEYNPVFYSGSETSSKKNKSIEKFKSGESKVILFSLRSGAGLDGLQYHCNYVVFGELDWTGAMHEQLIHRIHRNGQEKRVNAIFLISDSGSDPLVVDILSLKKSQYEGIFNPDGKQEKSVNDESIVKRLAHKILDRR